MTSGPATAWEDEVPQLKIELLVDGMLLLTSPDWQGNGDDMVQVHPSQLRLMAEKLGLVREVSASDAEIIRTLRGQVADSQRTARALVRRLRVLKERVDHLGRYLSVNSDFEHADLSYEQTYANATCDICDEFCADLEDVLACASEDSATPAADGKCHPEAMAERLQTHAGEPSSKACANPSRKASAKASVNPSGKTSGKGEAADTGSLFGGNHG